MKKLDISYQALDLARFARLLENVPRELSNGCIRMYDYLNSRQLPATSHQQLKLSEKDIEEFATRSNTQEGGLTALHQAYLDVLK